MHIFRGVSSLSMKAEERFVGGAECTGTWTVTQKHVEAGDYQEYMPDWGRASEIDGLCRRVGIRWRRWARRVQV